MSGKVWEEIDGRFGHEGPVEAPGDVLRRMIEDSGVSERTAAAKLGLSLRTLSEVLCRKRRITRRTARLLEALYPLGQGTWLRLQADWDTDVD